MAGDDNSLLQPGETLGSAVPAQNSAPASDASGLLQPGETLGETVQTPPPQRGVLENSVGGVTKGASKFVQGAANLAGEAVEHFTGMPEGSLQATRKETESPSTARNIGEGAENIGEYAAGDAGLEGAAKFFQFASKFPEAVKLMEAYPKAAKFIAGLGKAATVGAGQGAVKGAVEEKPGQGALEGGGGGVVGETAGEIASGLMGMFGKRLLGVGKTGVEDATQSFKPAKRNLDFAQKFQTAAPIIDKEPSYKAAKNVADQVEAIDTARENWWQQQVKPWIDKHTTEPLSGIAIRNNVESQIPESMKKYDPADAAKIQQFANEFMPGQKFALQVGDAERDLEYFNAKLASTGYWSKMPAERAALIKTNSDAIMAKAGADAIRDELYGHLAAVEPGVDMADLKAKYGALRHVGDELRGQINIEGRKPPTSMRELVGGVVGLATGGVKGLAAAALPLVDREANSATRLAARAVQKEARPGEESLAARGVQKFMDVVPGAGANLASQAGRIVFQASDGSTHSVPASGIKEALAVDPHLTITNLSPTAAETPTEEKPGSPAGSP
jgi:hypothetical protein